MNFINNDIGVMMNGMDIYSAYIIYGLAILFLSLVFFWFYRISVLVRGFLKNGMEVIGGKLINNSRVPPFYNTIEAKGIYKGREVSLGILYTGLKNEFLPLPHIQMKLKEAMGYNTNRVPVYAAIEKNILVYKVKLNVLWGIFDKNYPLVFTRNYLVIALEKLLATAEDVERGRTVNEIFK